MKQYPSRMGVGASSILLILVVVSLTLFAALSLMQARADAALTQKTAESIATFYDADARAQENGDEYFVGHILDARLERQFAGPAMVRQVLDARERDFVGCPRFPQRRFHAQEDRSSAGRLNSPKRRGLF